MRQLKLPLTESDRIVNNVIHMFSDPNEVEEMNRRFLEAEEQSRPMLEELRKSGIITRELLETRITI